MVEHTLCACLLSGPLDVACFALVSSLGVRGGIRQLEGPQQASALDCANASTTKADRRVLLQSAIVRPTLLHLNTGDLIVRYCLYCFLLVPHHATPHHTTLRRY